jgi:pectinesterase
MPGTYKEQVYIKALSGPVTIYGYTKDDSRYSSNEVIITGSKSQASVCHAASHLYLQELF